jgi:hypothetical protein
LLSGSARAGLPAAPDDSESLRIAGGGDDADGFVGVGKSSLANLATASSKGPAKAGMAVAPISRMQAAIARKR